MEKVTKKYDNILNPFQALSIIEKKSDKTTTKKDNLFVPFGYVKTV